MRGFRFGFGFGPGGATVVDPVLALFEGAHEGVGFYIDTSDRTLMWQDPTGQHMTLSDGDPVGLMLDTSQGVGVQENLTDLTIDGDFDDASSWGTGLDANSVIVSGQWVVTDDGSNTVIRPDTDIILEAGKTYYAELDVEYESGTSILIELDNGDNILVAGKAGFFSGYYTPDITKRIRLKVNSGGDATVNRYSIQEVTRTIAGLGDELHDDGDFNLGSAWTLTGADQITDDGSGINFAEILVSGAHPEAGKWYQLEFTIKSGLARVYSNASSNYPFPTSGPGSYRVLVFHGPGSGPSPLKFVGVNNGIGSVVSGVFLKEMPGNHAYQNAAASIPNWDETEQGVDFDGVDDFFKFGNITRTSDMAVLSVLSSSDDLAVLGLSGVGSNNCQLLMDQGSPAGPGSPDNRIDGVFFYDATRADLYDAVAGNGIKIAESRGNNLSVSAFDDLIFGKKGDNIAHIAGKIKGIYLTSNTDTAKLDAARRAAASRYGVSLRDLETILDQMGVGSVYAPSDDASALSQNSTSAVAVSDGDLVGRVTNPLSGGADVTQPTAAARPTWNATEKLFELDGVDDHFLADLTGIADRSDMYFACVVEVTDSQFMLISSNSSTSHYALSASNNSTSTNLLVGVGLPEIYIDGTIFAGTTRDDLHEALSGGVRHLVELIGADLSPTDFNTVRFGDFSTSGWNLSGLLGEIILTPNPGVIGRNKIRHDILTKHPSITFAGA